MDIIFIHDLRVDTVIGIYDWERRIRQSVVINLELGADIQQAARSDQIDHTLSYKTVAKRLAEFVSGSEFLLLESLAERIAELLQQEFKVPWLRLTLSKPGAVTGAREVGLIIER
ncbi:MAG: dihydroneopterin aldolase, partial [Candidatus Competibacteraceae bacterium]|nr:dihydroneopterin aldolase [Candidatus Competibacteraceae bacterium]